MSEKRAAKLYLICGMAGAGKSTLARQLESECQATRFSPDEWLRALMLDMNDRVEMARLRPIVTDLQWGQIQGLLRIGCDVIWEAGFWLEAERAFYREEAKGLGADVMLHYLTAPIDELKRRIVERNKDLPSHSFHIEPDELDKWMEWLDVPTEEEAARFDAFDVHGVVT
ncbi:MAG TPA: ATP-binding protein [Myxococcales bacterium]|nr:hypothetical protein [Deltaproteobacteria bacterium]HAA55524.1 ATP-binding protein [Myxococcales bacterium]|tara:strand:- start:19644 stop:20153 length:510 start_codon:yes stop_codon:yes gene_type:complete